MAEPRYCTNCRAEIPPLEDACPGCGVFAGEVFDGRLPRRPRRWRRVAGFLVIAAAVVVIGWLVVQRRGGPADLTEPPPVAVVSDRPGGSRRAAGAVINEAEAMRVLRRHFIATGIRGDCLVISSQGIDDGNYQLTAINRCEETRLGRWVVEGKSGAVRR
ncbi:MAG TPA: hypothetical protein VM779_09650 [Thermoanaerobaculia bacterium]|nr:hypothetical protein [Thermoanaerobaculia bacterium]